MHTVQFQSCMHACTQCSSACMRPYNRAPVMNAHSPVPVMHACVHTVQFCMHASIQSSSSHECTQSSSSHACMRAHSAVLHACVHIYNRAPVMNAHNPVPAQLCMHASIQSSSSPECMQSSSSHQSSQPIH